MKEMDAQAATDALSPIVFLGFMLILGILFSAAVLGLDWVFNAVIV